MTIDEAIEELGTLYVPRDDGQDRLADAQEMAIRSLEAWEKVKAEIEEIEKNYGFDKATKYGNNNAEQQILSYSTMMMYEIANIIDEIKENIDEHL